jgi:putative molybdopterin biosynthesis protein
VSVEWLTIPEVALRLRVSRMTVYRLTKTGVLPAYRVGRQLRVKAADLDAYLEAARQTRHTP